MSRREDTAKRRCRACAREFSSLFAFDRHRSGRYADRRCRTAPALLARGLELNPAGRWQRPGRIGGLSHWTQS